MQISVCMIVKDEEKVLERSLTCAKKFTDEIIVVDTGSSDKTKQIAQKFTNNVFDFVWCDNFAKARNFSFSKASKDYIMWLDADDFVSDENISKILELKKFANADCFMLKYATAFDEFGKPTFEFFRERILKNDKTFVWEGFVHEAITPHGKIEHKDIIVEHRKLETTYSKRNLKIYQKHKKMGEIFDERSQFYFAKEYYYHNHFKTAIKELKKFLKMKNTFLPNRFDATLTIMRCFNALGEFEKATKFGIDFLKTNVPSAEIACEIGRSFILLGKFKNAVLFYQIALNCKENEESGGFVRKEFYHLIPKIQLCYLYFKLGNFKEAKKYHMLAKEENPNNKTVLFNDKFFQ